MTSVGTTGKRSTSSRASRTVPRTTTAGPATRATAASPATRAPTSTLCETLYAQPGAVLGPYYTYNHGAKVVAGESCPPEAPPSPDLAFETGSNFPSCTMAHSSSLTTRATASGSMRAGADGDRTYPRAGVRPRRGQPGRSHLRSRRGAVLRGLRRRHHPPGRLYRDRRDRHRRSRITARRVVPRSPDDDSVCHRIR